ncbi:glycoside hydrolase family 9 protein [Herbivorax sp. ANBcel31]|uniref:glycoside hydrolase family 9 protein n=1 Tax=Herbivorax sp. ANBcel31 TaxID=3069754 RepID=UPI0027B02495|nr:glycoside hydrolase family 9 protein [Herbivorax sp. ANBcel31]MDQ2084819.1 glycoside hydrolase family 9 protein [Herbivorax sp. ANBcel31]
MKKTASIFLSLIMLLAFLMPKGLPMASAESSFNYAEALQKAIYFFECQQAGPLPSWNRVEWRGDSTLNDYVTGGWYDAGDHIKFNLPMAYSASMLGWALYEYPEGFEAAEQRIYMENNLRFVLDYLVDCNKGSSVVYQIGDGATDHIWWGPVEVIEQEMERPYFTGKGSAVTAQMAAALAIGSIIFDDDDYLTNAKSLFDIADTERSDSTYTAADGYYDSWSGFWDELTWAATWLYLATDDVSYLDKAESYIEFWGTEPQTDTLSYKWGHCWDDVRYGTQLLLARITNKDIYIESTERNLDFWTTGYNGERITYTPEGLAWLDQWGSLRYATTAAFLASVYADWEGCPPDKKEIYEDFAKTQVDYALGSTGRSFVVGFGDNPPQRPHHRTSHGAWADTDKEPEYHRHVLYGALVGGPGQNDEYSDEIDDFVHNEVACDYNAGFVAALSKMVSLYGGTPEENFPPKEQPETEFFVEASINSMGPNYTEIRAELNNRSAWPARLIEDLSFNYYVDLTEVFEAGYDVDDIEVDLRIAEIPATITQLKHYSDNIYYTKISYEDGTDIYPGGQSEHKREVQFRISAPQATDFWNPDNDFSYQGLVRDHVTSKTEYIPVYDGNTKLFGLEPESSEEPVLMGDLNGDGIIDSSDYVLLKRYVLEITSDFPIDNGELAADLNGDGVIDSSDCVLLQRYVLEIISEF